MAALGAEPNAENFVLVKTTLPSRPLPPNASRQPIITDRLVIRAWTPEDLKELRVLRTQPEVMRWTRVGHIDLDEAATQTHLNRYLPPNDANTYNCAITLKETGELIGSGGVHMFTGSFGWPELGYMFRTEFWGQGYGTEFVRGFVEAWSALPREEVEIKVDPRTATGDGVAEEQLIAITDGANWGSQKILRKCGFEQYLVFPGDDGGPLPTFRFFPARSVGQRS
jgi:RimJ/RimL family protein N-acetyltransferase